MDQLYANALTYWHGHSVGGTNPSLLRAAGAGTSPRPWTWRSTGRCSASTVEYFTTPDEVAQLLVKTESDPEWVLDCGSSLQQSIRRYNWEDVADRYEHLCRRLAQRDFPRRRPSGRRTGAWTDQPDPGQDRWYSPVIADSSPDRRRTLDEPPGVTTGPAGE